MLSINPSHREAQHLIKEVTGRENVNEFDELTTEEKEAVIAELKTMRGPAWMSTHSISTVTK